MKILLINPNKWGRGITSIWIASHSALLKHNDHEVKLFDATFYNDWTVDEVSFNTQNQQYKPTDYARYVTYSAVPVKKALQNEINYFQPDVIFWSAISSHIHGEGEYVNLQYGYELMEGLETSALLVAGGLQATARPVDTMRRYPNLDYLVLGYSEVTLEAICSNIDDRDRISKLPGVCSVIDSNRNVCCSSSTPIFNMSVIPEYDYSLFDDQVFWRPYNGRVLRAIDYELSRGCIYTCDYCVETTIQKYYGFNDRTERGTLKGARKYVQTKEAEQVFAEIKKLHEERGITLFRCQDTNFLTMSKEVLVSLSDMIDRSNLDIMLYIETRPESITRRSIELLKKLKVDGVGMGVELSSEEFRENKLSRYASSSKIIKAFKLLRAAGIKRTAYNIIGLPEQDENSIIETIRFNQVLDPDNITVAFYSPYLGTNQQIQANEIGYFDDYEYHVDGQLRTVVHTADIDRDLLGFYKAHFSRLVREGLDKLPAFKSDYMGIAVSNGRRDS